MFRGQGSAAGALVQARVGVVGAVAADVFVAENLLGKLEVDAFVGYARRIERVRPDGNVGDGVFADQVPLRVVLCGLRIGQ